MLVRATQITVAVMLSGACLLADAATLVDTGSPELTQNGAISVINYPYAHQSVGAGFSLSGSYNITDIASYFWIGNPGTLTLSLYSERSGLPGDQLFSNEFSIDGRPSIKGWFGLSGLNWFVASGNYWVTYEIRGTQTFNGALEFPPPFPTKMAVRNDYYTDWTSHPSGFGLIVEGTPASVPEPHSFIMFLAGLSLLGGMVRGRKQVSAWFR